MKRIKFSKLSFPRALNLDLLATILSEEKLIKLICDNCSKDRRDRRIMLPSRKTIKKAYCYYYGRLVDSGKMTWDEVMVEWGEGFTTLKEIKASRKMVKKLYEQRFREVVEEIKNER